MVQTRRAAQSSAEARSTNNTDKDNPSRPTSGRKSHVLSEHGCTDKSKPSKRRITNKKTKISAERRKESRPRLTTSDLEFDYDRSKLRDPRLTPGREARPCYGELDIPEELHTRLKATREISKAEKPKGRLSAAQRDKLKEEETLMNPLTFSHDIYKCLAKGRGGSPTYDDAGFELDYDKVRKNMNQAQSKHHMIRGTESALDTMEREENQMFELFFVDQRWKKNDEHDPLAFMSYVRDRVSKDLGVPWHQIKPKQLESWRDLGFEPFRFETWWQEPNEEEQKREDKLTEGADFRKDL